MSYVKLYQYWDVPIIYRLIIIPLKNTYNFIYDNSTGTAINCPHVPYSYGYRILLLIDNQ